MFESTFIFFRLQRLYEIYDTTNFFMKQAIRNHLKKCAQKDPNLNENIENWMSVKNSLDTFSSIKFNKMQYHCIRHISVKLTN